MIQLLAQQYNKAVACLLLTLFYCDSLFSAYIPLRTISSEQYVSDPTGIHHYRNVISSSGHYNSGQDKDHRYQPDNNTVVSVEETPISEFELIDESGGPTQPEMQAFQPVNSNNMVDLFTGDFSYNIPLMDVGGYPINLSYRSGISMDQEASWVGLGWNVNPGTITRNLRGLPDDFNGKTDTIRKVNHIRDNQTVGVNVGAGIEGFGLPFNVGINGGIFHNNYRGIGLEYGANVSIGAGTPAKGLLTAGLSFQNNSQEGLSITPTLSYRNESTSEEGLSGNISTSLSYNSRIGLKAMQFSAGLRQTWLDKKNQQQSYSPDIPSGSISFALPAYNPKMSIAYTSSAYTFTAKIGSTSYGIHPYATIAGYVSMQGMRDKDTVVTLPAYGYFNYQNGQNNPSALLDYNRERDIPYREKPAVPHIGLPSYTYDVFSMTGEGTGGMFRGYRGDIGYVFDHYMKSRDASDAGSLDLGVGQIGHVGFDLNVNRAYTQSGPWNVNNELKNSIKFTASDKTYEAVYFKNPGEKSINPKTFYEALGGDDVVTAQLLQNGINDENIQTSNLLNRYKSKRLVGTIPITSSIIKTARDKRKQVITYLSANEASRVGLSRYIEDHVPNTMDSVSCNKIFPESGTYGVGLLEEYFTNENLEGDAAVSTTANKIDYDWGNGIPHSGIGSDHFSMRWSGFIKVPETGKYIIKTQSDDGVRLWLNDTLVINNWDIHGPEIDLVEVNLVKDQFIKVKMEYYEHEGGTRARLFWTYSGHYDETIPTEDLYQPTGQDVVIITPGKLSIEKRINSFRKPNHISEIDVLNADGRRYVYGIPVYNFLQRDVTFAVNHPSDPNTNIIDYANGDNSVNNQKGQDWYYSSETTPAYAHSFLLSAILSQDYVDIGGDGISDDDLGDAIKFNYSKVAGINNPYTWRTPATGELRKASYNEGLKTDIRDDKAYYVYGEKELWYLNTIESKNMIAVFIVANRTDLPSVTESGNKVELNLAKRLTDIKLYAKPDFLKNGPDATPIKTVHFDYDYSLCKGQFNDSGKLTLRRVSFSYNGNSRRQNPYVFSYSGSNPAYNSRNYDKWGNYKASSSNQGNMSNAEYPYPIQKDYSTDNTSLINANATAWTLDSIMLPSGGRIKVNYESDDYAYVQNKRAMQMFRISGLAYSTGKGYSNRLYTLNGLSTHENLIVYASVNKPVVTAKDVYEHYLEGIDSIFFKLFVKMPGDKWGGGNEFVNCYASIDKSGIYYGVQNANTIWFKIKGINKDADGPGSQSPLVKASLQFLRLNLPSKAYPGSDVGSTPNLADFVKLVGGMTQEFATAIIGYETNAKSPGRQWCSEIDTNKSMVRLDNPDYKKFGGGLRVKKISIYDNWSRATGQTESIYGQEYTYTTIQEIHGINTVISSGVASYEPSIGGEENPWHVPIQYKEQASVLGPTSMGYTDEPLGESFFPSPGVGYSKVRVRSINSKNRRSATGYEETSFYTSYDFPASTDRSIIDSDTKKRYKPALANFLRINAKHFVAISQGFKIELNDMNGKVRSQATYPETDSINPISYTENFYRVDDQSAGVKHLNNTVYAIGADGIIDTAAIIGKDMELMIDMREQLSTSQGFNFSPNLDFFAIGFFPGMFPSLIPMPQSESNIFHSVATTKVIQCYGILDSVIHVEKGSKVSTKNMIYDSETGDVVLTRTNNEFDDPLYNFSRPAHWSYDRMGGAYKNIHATFSGIKIIDGKIVSGISEADQLEYFASGDEIMIESYEKTTDNGGCDDSIASFPTYGLVWAIDKFVLGAGGRSMYFIDANGEPFSGDNISMKIIRSGRRNINTTIETITTLKNPVKEVVSRSGNHFTLEFNEKVINASAVEFKENWQVADRKKQIPLINCVGITYPDCPAGRTTSCTCSCLKGLFDYIIQHNYLYTNLAASLRVDTLVNRAAGAGYSVSLYDCNILSENASGYFYAETFDTTGYFYKAHIGNCSVTLTSTGSVVNFSQLTQGECNIENTVVYKYKKPKPKCLRHEINLRPDVCSYFLIYKDCNGSTQQKNLSRSGSSCWGDGVAENLCAQEGSIIYDSTKIDVFVEYLSNLCESSTDSIVTDVRLTIDTCISCTYAGTSCISTITDTVVNPYRSGLLGNFRVSKSCVPYTERAETGTDPITAPVITRRDGTFNYFQPYYEGADQNLWVWNSESTIFNQRGLELESKDPLGRYNAGLYGYNLTLPVAIAQNSKYREMIFEGFEDYDYKIGVCNTACATSLRQIDFTFSESNITDTMWHTGRYSMRINQEDDIGVSIGIKLADIATIDPAFDFQTANTNCASNTLKGIRVDTNALIRQFAPTPGETIVVSGWLREQQDCLCTDYTHAGITLSYFDESAALISTDTVRSKGAIVEGWQRFEKEIMIPANAKMATMQLQTDGLYTTFFDDLRIHPYNANMKSFVYDPISLRLVAELDENNYATFYEYDDDGTLVRVKKETERGIKTIKETRSVTTRYQ